MIKLIIFSVKTNPSWDWHVTVHT